MSTTKQQHGDGTWTETTVTEYPSGGSKTEVKDITDRDLLNDGHVKTVIRTDKDGNSRTKNY